MSVYLKPTQNTKTRMETTLLRKPVCRVPCTSSANNTCWDPTGQKKYNYYYNTNTGNDYNSICFVLLTYKFYRTVPRRRQQKIVYGVLTPIYAAHFFLVFVKRSYRFLPDNRYDISVILKIILSSILHYVYNTIINYLLLVMDIYNSTSARFRLRWRSPTNCTQICSTPRQTVRLPNAFHTFWLLDICLRHILPKTTFRHL